MERAKAAVSDFMAKAGHHDTEVHERVAPAVTHETIKGQQREERQVALDREVHQDHYHTTVQPVTDREVLPEQHHTNIVPVEHRTHDHHDEAKVKARLAQEAAQYKDTSVRAETQHTSAAAPSLAGEHVHHHIHETIQPVVQKETIEPHVVHTVVPIHEVHHNDAQHHAATALPAVSLADFKKQGGSLTGREERVDHFAGEPKSLEHTLGGTGSHHASGAGVGTGVGAGAAGVGAAGAGSKLASRGRRSSSVSSSDTETKRKPSLMDKLNPKKDADGDGKAGFMK